MSQTELYISKIKLTVVNLSTSNRYGLIIQYMYIGKACRMHNVSMLLWKKVSPDHNTYQDCYKTTDQRSSSKQCLIIISLKKLVESQSVESESWYPVTSAAGTLSLSPSHESYRTLEKESKVREGAPRGIAEGGGKGTFPYIVYSIIFFQSNWHFC